MSATALSSIRVTLENDISELSTVKSTEQETKDFIQSLVEAKQKVLSLIPENDEGLGGVPGKTNAQQLGLYLNFDTISNQRELMETIQAKETNQMEYVRESLSADGMTTGIKNILANILNIYMDITDQINRSVKTNNVSSLVI